jgi:Ca2+-binding RTX toxin-like protein
MAVYNFSALADGQAISFNPATDLLNFDQTLISAADIRAVAEGTGVRIFLGDKDILLQNTTPQQLATSNVMFANGSALLFGDNSAGTANDNFANTLTGTSGNDLLQGFGGADTMNGGLGNDTYIVSTGDVVSDSGGVDTIVSDVSWNMGAEFENITLTGTTRTDVQGNNLNNRIIGSDAANFIKLI